MHDTNALHAFSAGFFFFFFQRAGSLFTQMGKCPSHRLPAIFQGWKRALKNRALIWPLSWWSKLKRTSDAVSKLLQFNEVQLVFSLVSGRCGRWALTAEEIMKAPQAFIKNHFFLMSQRFVWQNLFSLLSVLLFVVLLWILLRWCEELTATQQLKPTSFSLRRKKKKNLAISQRTNRIFASSKNGWFYCVT